MTKLSVDQALLKAKFYVKRGEVEEAQKLYQMVLQAFPKNKRAQQGLVALNTPKQSIDVPGPPQEAINQLINLYNQGQMAAVIEQATPMTEQYPEAFMIWNILGAANKGLNRVADASKAFSKVTELNPNYADGFNNLGIILKEQGKLDEAIASYNKALAIKPDYAEACNNMGNALQDQGKLDKAMEAYNKALAIKPDYAEAYNNMGNALQDQGKLDEAIEAFNKALAIMPDYAGAYYDMGNALQEQGKLDEAVDAYNKALATKPDHAGAYNNMGNALQDQGKLDEAIQAYTKALSLKPDYAAAHRNLSLFIKYKPNHLQVTTVGEMIKRSDLKDDDRCNLHYAFAKMNEDIGKLDVAFKNYVAGGKLRKKLLSYDLKQDQLAFCQIKATAPKLKDTLLNKHIEVTPHTPIFILGMPRSGTTLVEQIISSHSKIHGAGELSFLGRFAAPISLGNQIINSDSIFQVRTAYLNELDKASNGSPFVTDKLPHNFLHIGLILKAFPEAKIIHVKRNPAATCWSNFKNYFVVEGLGYSCDLEDAVGYFKLYQDLMVFWDGLYRDQIYHLDYDRLTFEQEMETRKLIEYIELDWEDTCLKPHENQRSVRTASQQQVRKKVYSGSSDAWLKFEPYLEGVFDELRA